MDRWYETAKDLERRNEGFVLATVVRAIAPTSAKPGDKAVVTEDGVVQGWIGGSCAEPTVRKEAKAALADGVCRVVQITPDPELPMKREGLVVVPMTCYSGGELEIYLEPHPAKAELLVFGNSPVAQALIELGVFAGYRVTVVDTTERPPLQGATVVRELDAAEIKRPERAAIVVATHGVFDEDAIARAAELRPRYLGVVASPKRFSSLAASMKRRGLPSETWAQIDGPAGLDIGARTPQEIAISIIASITAQRESIEVSTTRPSKVMEKDQVAQPNPVVAKATPEPPPTGTEGKGSCCHD
ncbi:MAG: XdhC family protein [Polyangiales bacterium]|jgi:xanthine dehydrogenase accessory factor